MIIPSVQNRTNCDISSDNLSRNDQAMELVTNNIHSVSLFPPTLNNVNTVSTNHSFDLPSAKFNTYRVGAWNLNGWKSIINPENTNFRANVIKLMDLDIYLLSETHCLKDETISIEGFTIYNYNRNKISPRAIRGSGGVAIAISNKLLNNHSIVATYKGTYDGILALKLTNN